MVGTGVSIAIYRNVHLGRNHRIIRGKITSLEVGVRGNPAVFVNYSFQLNQKSIQGKTALLNTNSLRDYKFLHSLLENKSLPIIFQKDNFENNKMLFTKQDFEKYKVTPTYEEEEILTRIDSLIDRENKR
jgi:hypothetical protein